MATIPTRTTPPGPKISPARTPSFIATPVIAQSATQMSSETPQIVTISMGEP
jgi:hypothetical protein